METNTGGVTVRTVEPFMEPKAAWIVVLPWPALLAKPVGAMDAMPEADELQVTEAVTSRVLPLLNFPAAVNCWVLPAGIEGLAGVTTIEVRPLAFPVPLRLTTLWSPNAL